jgi:hypothetical protein
MGCIKDYVEKNIDEIDVLIKVEWKKVKVYE